MPAKAKTSRTKGTSRKPPPGPLVEAALREAKSAGEYPLTVRRLFTRLHAAGTAGIVTVLRDPDSLLKALGRKPLKNDGTIFAKALDAPVALPEDQALLFTSQVLFEHLAARVKGARLKKQEQPKKNTIAAFIKDAGLSGKAMKPAANAVTKHLESLLSASRLPESLVDLIEVDPADRLLRMVTEASASISAASYPVPEALLRAVPGASALLDGDPGKHPVYSTVASIHVPGAAEPSPRYLLARDLPNIVRMHLPEAIESIGRRLPDTGLFSAEEIAREFLDPPDTSRHPGKGVKKTPSKASSAGKTLAARLAAAADAIEAAASRRETPPMVAWLMDGGERRYFLRSKVEPFQTAPLQPSGHASASTVFPDPADFALAFDRAFAEATAGSGGRQIVTLGTLRQKLDRFSREQFDEGLSRLWGRSYSLETANDRRSLAAADLAAAIVKGGSEYVYVVRRS